MAESIETRVRVVIVDDHDVVREGLRAILRRHPRFEVVGEAGDGRTACETAIDLAADLVVMDLSMPDMNGTDATRRLLDALPHAGIVVLTAHENPAYLRELLSAGARGYVVKRSAAQNLLRALDVVADGGIFLDPSLASRSGRARATGNGSADLSLREIEVASMASHGSSNAEIAAALGISQRTVETHKRRLMAKLNLKTRAELVRYAVYRGWIAT